MRLMLATAISAALCGAPLAAECTLYNARYKQPDAPWWLTFTQVPQFAPANQTAAFYLELPNSDVTLQGRVSVPNGFGAPLWSIEGPCGTDSEESCGFLDEYQTPSIYGVYDSVVRLLESERGPSAPQQVILPELASSLWYSQYRQSEWFDDAVSPGDAFVLVGCD